MSAEEDFDKKIESVIKSLDGLEGEMKRQKLSALKQIKEDMKLGGDRAKNAKEYLDIIDRDIASIKKRTSATFKEAETIEDATKALMTDMKQRSLITKMMGKNYDNDGKLTTKKTNLLARDFGDLGNAAKNLGRGNGGFQSLLQITGVYGGLLGAVCIALDDTLEHYRSLRENGASLDDSMMTMRMNASAAGMSLDSFSEFINGTSAEVRRFGMEGLGAVTNSTRSAMANVGNLGMTTEMTTKALGDYMETETARMTYNQMKDKDNQAKISQNFQTFVKDVDGVSKATGVARKDIMAAFKNFFKDDTMALLTKDMFGKAKDNMALSVTAISQISQPVGDLMSEMIKDQKAFGSGIRSGTSAIMEGFAPGFADLTKKIGDGTMTAAQSTRAMANMAKGIDKNSIPQLEAMSRAGDEGAKKLLNLARQSEALQSAAQRAEEAENSKLKSFSVLMQNIEGIGQKLSAVFGGVINVVGTILSPMFNMLSKLFIPISAGLSLLGDLLVNITTGISDFQDKITDFFGPTWGDHILTGMTVAMIGMGMLLKRGFSSFFGWLKTGINSVVSVLEGKVRATKFGNDALDAAAKAKDTVTNLAEKAKDKVKDTVGSALKSSEGIMRLIPNDGSKSRPLYVIMIDEGIKNKRNQEKNSRQEFLDKNKTTLEERKKARQDRINGKTPHAAGVDLDSSHSPTTQGKISKVGKIMGKMPSEGKMMGLGALGMVASVGLSALASKISEDNPDSKMAKGVNAASGVASAAMSGASMGAMMAPLLGPFAPLGPIIGGLIGGIIGIIENFDDIAELCEPIVDVMKDLWDGLVKTVKFVFKYMTPAGWLTLIYDYMSGKGETKEAMPTDISADAGRSYGAAQGNTQDLYGVGNDGTGTTLSANAKEGDFNKDTTMAAMLEEARKNREASEEANEIAKAKLAKDAQDNKKIIEATNRTRNDGAYNINV